MVLPKPTDQIKKFSCSTSSNQCLQKKSLSCKLFLNVLYSKQSLPRGIVRPFKFYQTYKVQDTLNEN